LIVIDLMEDHVNPRRQYHGLRPRQSYRGAITLTGPTNNATLGLFNGSKSTHVIVVRDFVVITTVGHLVAVTTAQSSFGTSGGLITPGVTGDAAGPGQLQSLDTATALTADNFVPVQFNWPQFSHDFPFQVLQPGWAVEFQDTTAAETMRLAMTWEAIAIDELDFLMWPDGR